MIKGVIIFIAGYLCGHYTDQVKDFCMKLINKLKKKETEEQQINE